MAETDLARDSVGEAVRNWKASGWDHAAPGMAAVTTIVRVNRLLVARVEQALAPHGLTFARFEILRLLGFAREKCLPMGKIGARLQVHPASVTSAVKRLERDGFISRRSAEHDSRIVLACLRPTGERLLEAATADINDVFSSLEWSDGDIEQLRDLLGEIES